MWKTIDRRNRLPKMLLSTFKICTKFKRFKWLNLQLTNCVINVKEQVLKKVCFKTTTNHKISQWLILIYHNILSIQPGLALISEVLYFAWLGPYNSSPSYHNPLELLNSNCIFQYSNGHTFILNDKGFYKLKISWYYIYCSLRQI